MRDSPVHDEQEELDDIPMEQMNEEDPAPSNPQATKDVDMDQADNDSESDSTVQESELHQPKQKAMPMNPPTLKIKASPQSSIDEETESERMTIPLLKESDHSESFWNSRFLSYVQGYYKECSTILESSATNQASTSFLNMRENRETRFSGLWHDSMSGGSYLPRTWATHGACIHGLHQEDLQHFLPCQCRSG